MSRKYSETPRLAHTYSVVARDEATGEFGVAVQSHYFATGTAVPWAASGVGAVATQAMVNIAYGPRGLESMRAGRAAPDALRELVEDDRGRELRQVAMVDAQGRVAAHTGALCIEAAGHHMGNGYSAQGNMLSNDRVWPAMASAFESASGDLAERMMVALEAGETAGGDVRGRQSAALLVVRGESTGRPWDDRLFDLRVDDHAEPLVELRRLMGVRRANMHEELAHAAMRRADYPGAAREFAVASGLNPANLEIPFWRGIGLIVAGRVDEGCDILAPIFRREPQWRELAVRLPKVRMLPKDAALLERLARL